MNTSDSSTTTPTPQNQQHPELGQKMLVKACVFKTYEHGKSEFFRLTYREPSECLFVGVRTWSAGKIMREYNDYDGHYTIYEPQVHRTVYLFAYSRSRKFIAAYPEDCEAVE